MSISEKKRLSEKKELFLAICLISGEISSETIRRMKADFGDTQIKNNVIQSLRKDGYIKRVNRKNAGYGYQLTSSGLAYMKIKFPERYEYDLFSESKAYTYDENVRYRNTTLSAILYYLPEYDTGLIPVGGQVASPLAEFSCVTVVLWVSGLKENFTEVAFALII